MNLIDRYVAEVGRQLPEKMRADIESEMRSTLEDMLEDRSQKAQRPVDEALTCEVLQEYGSPEKVAASYLPARYLIGPRLFAQFDLVLRIVLAVIVGSALLRFGMVLAQNGPTADALLQLVLKTLLELIASALSALGNIVLVFALLERVLPEIKTAEEKWDPRQLPDSVEPDRLKLGEGLLEIGITLGVLLVLNFYPEVIRLGFYRHGEWTSVPILSEAFYRYLPWINAASLLQIIQNIILLRQGRWQPATRWLSVAVNLFSLGVTYALLTGPTLIRLTAEELQSLLSVPLHTASLLATMTNFSLMLALFVVLVVESIEIVLTIYKLLRKRRPSPVAQKSE